MLPQPNFVYCLWHKIWATGYDLIDKVTVSNDDDIIPLSLYDCFKGFWAIWTTTNLEELREKKKAINYFLKSSILDVWLGSQILGFTKYCLRCDSYQNTTTYLKLLILNKYANANKKMGRSHKVFIFWNLTGKHNNIKFLYCRTYVAFSWNETTVRRRMRDAIYTHRGVTWYFILYITCMFPTSTNFSLHFISVSLAKRYKKLSWYCQITKNSIKQKSKQFVSCGKWRSWENILKKAEAYLNKVERKNQAKKFH